MKWGNDLLDLAERFRQADGLAKRPLHKREVLTWTATGYSSKLIAHRLNLSARTVEHQIASAQKRLGAQNRTHVVAKALVLNLIEP